MEQDKTRTLLISCQHSAQRAWGRPGETRSEAGVQAVQASLEAPEVSAEWLRAETRDRPGPSTQHRGAEEGDNLTRSRHGPATGQGWILTWVRTRQPRDTERRLVMLRTGTFRHKVNIVRRSIKNVGTFDSHNSNKLGIGIIELHKVKQFLE